MDKNALKIRQAVKIERENVVKFLKSLVDQNSFTLNTEGVDKVASILSEAMPGVFRHETVDGGPRFARHHIFSKPGRWNKPVVLVGHMDTLWKPESNFRSLYEKGDKLIGPAVNDMKAGLTVIVWALKVLETCGLLEDLPIKVVFNSEEETGSTDSKKIFLGFKDAVAAGLVYEGAGVGGTVVTKRVGITDYSLEASGVAAHAGLYYGPKKSALLEMAHRIIWLESLNQGRDKLSVNAGRIEGGLATNIVPDRVKCNFEIRFWDEKELKKNIDMIKSKLSEPVISGCVLELTEGKHRPPLSQGEGEKKLYRCVSRTASLLGQKVKEEHRNGGSDASWLSAAGVPSIDGLGPVGDLDRTEEEYIITETMFERIELTANLILSEDLYSG
ncbi:MAG TPA: M20/M25/M40 family metallo-hydrolase [bacterium]|nr:M20/M25/M40 family metallo-hydrolase [bacterium]